MEDHFSVEQGWEDGFGVIQARFVYVHFISNLMLPLTRQRYWSLT